MMAGVPRHDGRYHALGSLTGYFVLGSVTGCLFSFGMWVVLLTLFCSEPEPRQDTVSHIAVDIIFAFV